ncbi:MAG: DUF4397 domain-containing protein [Burkholderiales bacterium]
MTFPRMLRRSFFAVCLVVLAIAGCKINTINYFPPHPAQVRVLNLLPGSTVDVQITGQPSFTNVAFETITGYQTYVNQSTQFTVTFSGTSTQIGSFTIPLGGDQPYTLVVYGTSLAPLVTLVAEVAQAPTNGNVQLAVFNAAANNPNLDLYLTAPGVDIANVGPNFSFISYSGNSFNLAFAPGTYQIRATVAGTKTVVYDSGGQVYTPNIALTFIAYAVGSGTLVNAAVMESKGPYRTLNTIFSRLKAVNAAAGPGNVNMLQDNVPLINGVNYPSGSLYSLAARGNTTVSFEASAAPGTSLGSVSTTLAPATDTTAVIAGTDLATTAFVLQDYNILPASGGNRVRFVNASLGSRPVNASITGTQVATGIAFGTASAYVATSPATVTITFTDAETGAVVATQGGIVFSANQTLSVYLVGPPGGQGVMVTLDY